MLSVMAQGAAQMHPLDGIQHSAFEYGTPPSFTARDRSMLAYDMVGSNGQEPV